jgi:hypothetical protein
MACSFIFSLPQLLPSIVNRPSLSGLARKSANFLGKDRLSPQPLDREEDAVRP